MKKVLFGTTALVAAAFAGQAMAKDVKLSIVGDVTAGVGVGPVNENSDTGFSDASVTATGYAGGNVDKDFHIINEAEIQFKAKGTLDNGITVEVRVELEGYSTGDQMDENWVKVSSSFGSILIGNNDTALDNIAGGIGRMGGGTAGGSWDRGYTFVPGATGTHLGDESDEMAIHYYSPNIAGFELGVSWAPGTGQGTAGGDESDVDTNTDVTNSNDEISIGASYANSFGDVDFAIGGGYFQTTNDADTQDDTAYGGGIELGFGGFTIGGAVHFRDGEVAGAGEDELVQYGAGIEYATGPWVFGLNGFMQEYEDNATSNEDWESYVINAAVGYELGDGVNIGLGLDYGSIDYNNNITAGHDDEDAFGGVLLLGVAF